MVLARLVQTYETVLLPFGENQRYDMVIDDGERFVKVQCKTGRLRDGVVRFNTCSFTYHHPANRGTRPYAHHYRGAADVFGVYCPDTDSVYMVPVADVGSRAGCLRVEPSRNNQSKKVRWAADYELKMPG
jgi:hypothetical protein